MKTTRNLYKVVGGVVLLICLFAGGGALWLGSPSMMLLCVVAAGILIVIHLNHLFAMDQFAQLQSRLDSRLTGIDLKIQERAREATSRFDDLLEQQRQNNRIIEAARTTTAEVQAVATDLVRRTKINSNAITTLHKAQDNGNRALRRQLDVRFEASRVQMERMPGEIVGFSNAASSLLAEASNIPLLGGWAVSASTLTTMLSEVKANPHIETIVECGSGVSTIWLGLACKSRGRGHVFALEHEPSFAELTRRYVKRNGLDDWVTIIDAPLVLHTIDGDDYRWYSLSGLEEVKSVDLLFVDGPPAGTGPMARYPAFRLLEDKLSCSSWVVLDDTVRKEERDIATAWCALGGDGVSLTPLYELPKSMVMLVTRAPTLG